jgi:hypothetical protein
MVDRRARDRGLTVEFEEGATTAYTTTGSVVLPSPKLPITHDELDLIYGYMIHETGHHTRPRAFEILNNTSLKQEHPIVTLFNIVEDNAMEQEVSSKYSGDRKALGKGMLGHVRRQIARLKELPPEFYNDEEQIKCMAVYMMALECRLGWDVYAKEAIELYEGIPPPSSQELYKELEAEGWVARQAANMTPEQAWDLACDLYTRLYPDEDKDNTEKLKEEGKNNAKSEVGEKSEKEKAVVKGEGEKDEEGEVVGYTAYSWKDWVNSDHNKEGLPAVIDWEGRVFQDNIAFLDTKNVNVVNCQGGLRPTSKVPKVTSNASADALANAIRIYIQAQARTKIKSEQYIGKIDRRAVTRLAFPPIDGGEWNKRIFYRLENRKYKNTCIGILTDWSGSMNGQKKDVAAEATARLSRVFDIQLRVPTTIAAFSGTYGTCTIGLIKDFYDKDSTRSIMSKFEYFNSHTCGNADGDALMWMYNKLSARREQRKIILVLSDGAPTDGKIGSNPDDLLKAVAQSIERKPGFTLIGIGIGTTQVKRYYKNYRVLYDIKDLNKELIKVLKDTYTHD